MEARVSFEKVRTNLKTGQGTFCCSMLVCLFVSLCFVFIYFYFAGMGQATSTPLDLVLSHMSEVKERAHNIGVKVRKSKLKTFCISEWPTFRVEWPREGTCDLQVVQRVQDVILNPGPSRHPDQVPYIITWQSLVEDPPNMDQGFDSLTGSSKSIGGRG